MAKLICLLLLLRLTSLASAQVTNSTSSASISEIASSASDAASSASDAASTASSLSSLGSSTAASSAASIASSISSVASSLSSIASSVSSVDPPTSTATSSSATATEPSSSVAPPPSTSSSPTSPPESTSSTFSPVTLESTSTSVSFAPSTIATTSVIPTTQNGVVGFSTVTTFVVSSAPATTYVNVSPYTTSELAPGADPTTQAGASQSDGGGGGLSTGAKIGIGVGVGLAVLAAAIFGGWYSWFMRKRRRRSISASDRYPPSSLPSMIHMGGGAGAALGYADKSDTRSELPSPPIGGSMGGHNSPPLKSNHLVPVGAGVRSWNSVSNSNAPGSNRSVSDYSERGGQPPADPNDTAGPGYFPPAVAAGPVHEMGDSPNRQGYTHHQINPQTQYSHSRTISGTSQPSELGDSTGAVPASHQRTLSGSTQQGHYQSPSIGSDGFWHDTQAAQELHGSPPYVAPAQRPAEGYRGVDPEVPLHQRMQTERVPVRPGHLQKNPPNLPPSHNY